jgi:3-dehydroquinate dehydratase-1
MRPLIVRGKTLSSHEHALICTPLVGSTADALRAELALILPKRPDVIEWRVDFFAGVDDPAQVIDAARMIRREAVAIPIIFTRRAAHEGGETISIAEEAVVGLYEAVCASGAVDIIDYELSQPAENRSSLRAMSLRHGVAMILSYHNFEGTPTRDALVATLTEAQHQGADIAKVAVMPQTTADVLVLLEATLTASQRLNIPLITMSMGAMGAMTRICGGQFGSALTFAVGNSSSAPGQIAIQDLRAALKTLEQTAPQG